MLKMAYSQSYYPLYTESWLGPKYHACGFDDGYWHRDNSYLVLVLCT